VVTKRGVKKGSKGPPGDPQGGTPPVFTRGGYPLTFKLSLSRPPQKGSPRGVPGVKSDQKGSRDTKNPAKNRSFFSDTPVFTREIEVIEWLRSARAMFKNRFRHPEIGVHSGFWTPFGPPKGSVSLHLNGICQKTRLKADSATILTSRPQKPRFSTQKS